MAPHKIPPCPLLRLGQVGLESLHSTGVSPENPIASASPFIKMHTPPNSSERKVTWGNEVVSMPARDSYAVLEVFLGHETKR